MQTENGKIYYQVGLDNSKLKADAAKTQTIISGIGGTAVKEGKKIDNTFKKVGATITAAFAIREGAEFAKQVVKVRGEIQSLGIAFETMLGSKAKSDAMMKSAVEISLKTPYTLTEVASNIKQLIAMGIPAEKSVATLKSLGNVAAGLSVPMSRIAINFGQVSALGKLQGRELRDFAMAGVPILAQLADMLNKSKAEITDMISAGKIGFPLVEQAFENMSSKGGQFDNMMERLNSTVTGQISNLQDRIIVMMNEIGKEHQGLIYSVISGTASVVDNYKKVEEALIPIILTLGAYKAAVIATNVVQKVSNQMHYSSEAAELFKLLTVQQQETIINKNLSETSKEYAAAVDAATQANLRAVNASLAKAKVEVSTASKTLTARRAEYTAAKEAVIQRQVELATITKTGTAKEIEIAQRKLNSAITKKETTAISFQSAAHSFSAKKTEVETAAKVANSTATAVNTATEVANTTSTNILTLAKSRLIAMAIKLRAAIMSNPYAAAAAAVAALAYGIYKLVSYQSEAEKEQRKLNDAIKESKRNIDSEVIGIDTMFERLKSAKKGTDEYRAAKEAIQSKYGKYLEGLSNEAKMLDDVATAYAKITEEAQKAAKARAMESFMSEAANSLSATQLDVKEKIQKQLQKQFKGQKDEQGNDLAETYYLKIRPVIEGGDITPEIQSIIDKMDKTIYQATNISSTSNGSYIYNDITNQLNVASKAMDEYAKRAKQAQLNFGEESKKIVDTDAVDNSKKSIEELNVSLERARETLEGLKKAKELNTFEIIAQQKDVESIQNTIIEREKELKVIKRVKAQIKELQTEQQNYSKDSKEYKGLDTRIIGLQAKLPDDSSSNSSIQDDIADRNKKIQEYGKSIAAQYTQTELELEQTRIDLMKNGTEKTLAQNKLDYDRLIVANKKRAEDMVQKLKEQRELEWQNQNPDYKEKGTFFDSSLITVADLSDQQKKQIEVFYDYAEQTRQEANKKSLTTLLAEYSTYEQQRIAILKKYEEEKAFLYNEDGTLKSGVTQGNVDNLETKKQTALTSLDETFASKQQSYKDWMATITDDTLEQLDAALKAAQDELDKLGTQGESGSKAAGIARAKIAKIKETKDSKNSTTPDKKAVKKWKELNESLKDTQTQFDKVGDAVGGTVGKIIQSTSTILTSSTQVINGIVTLVQMAAASEAAAAVGAATAISTVEKASVILAIISAALQVAMAIIQMFNKDDVVAQFNNDAEKLNDELKLIKINALIGSDDADSIFGEDLWKNAITNINATREALELYNNTLEELKGNSTDAATAVANMKVQIQHSTWFRKEKYTSLAEAVPELFNADGSLNKDALSDFIGSDIFKKLSEENQTYLQQLSDQWDAYKDGVEATTDYLTDIFGDLGSTMMDALVDSWESGTDAAKAYGEAVGNILETMGKQMIYSVVFGSLFDKAQAKMQAIMDNQEIDETEKFSGFASVLSDLVNSVSDAGPQAKQLADDLKALAAAKGIDVFSDNSSREANSSGIATASQDSVDINNGRLTEIQGITYEIGNNMKTLVGSSGEILNVLNGIRDNTEACKGLDDIKKDMSYMRSDIESIATRGITIKN